MAAEAAEMARRATPHATSTMTTTATAKRTCSRRRRLLRRARAPMKPASCRLRRRRPWMGFFRQREPWSQCRCMVCCWSGQGQRREPLRTYSTLGRLHLRRGAGQWAPCTSCSPTTTRRHARSTSSASSGSPCEGRRRSRPNQTLCGGFRSPPKLAEISRWKATRKRRGTSRSHTECSFASKLRDRLVAFLAFSTAPAQAGDLVARPIASVLRGAGEHYKHQSSRMHSQQ